MTPPSEMDAPESPPEREVAEQRPPSERNVTTTLVPEPSSPTNTEREPPSEREVANALVQLGTRASQPTSTDLESLTVQFGADPSPNETIQGSATLFIPIGPNHSARPPLHQASTLLDGAAPNIRRHQQMREITTLRYTDPLNHHSSPLLQKALQDSNTDHPTVELTTYRVTVNHPEEKTTNNKTSDDDSSYDSEIDDLWRQVAIGNGSYDGQDDGIILDDDEEDEEDDGIPLTTSQEGIEKVDAFLNLENINEHIDSEHDELPLTTTQEGIEKVDAF